MSDRDDEVAQRIVGHLDAGLTRLDARTQARLLAARQVALSHYGESASRRSRPDWRERARARILHHVPRAPHRIAAALTITIALAGLIYWQTRGGPAHEIAEIDANILTDELPLNAYLDEGFDSWLKRSSL